jgi:dienelactone hydrolase
MHGCGGLDATARKWADIWTAHLAKGQIGTLTVDSFSTRGVKSTCGSPDAHWARRRVDDAYSALDWLVTRPDVRPDQIFVMGRSNGGRAVLNALQSIYRSMRKTLFAGGISLYPYCADRKGDHFYAPLLLLAAELDDANPSVLCRELGDTKRPPNHPELLVKIYPKVLHGFDDGSPARTFNGWRLGGDAAAAADARLQVSEFLARRGAATP